MAIMHIGFVKATAEPRLLVGYDTRLFSDYPRPAPGIIPWKTWYDFRSPRGRWVTPDKWVQEGEHDVPITRPDAPELKRRSTQPVFECSLRIEQVTEYIEFGTNLGGEHRFAMEKTLPAKLFFLVQHEEEGDIFKIRGKTLYGRWYLSSSKLNTMVVRPLTRDKKFTPLEGGPQRRGLIEALEEHWT